MSASSLRTLSRSQRILSLLVVGFSLTSLAVGLRQLRLAPLILSIGGGLVIVLIIMQILHVIVGSSKRRLPPSFFTGQAAVKGSSLPLLVNSIDRSGRLPHLLQGHVLVRPEGILFVPLRRRWSKLKWEVHWDQVRKSRVDKSGGRAFLTLYLDSGQEVEIWTTGPSSLQGALDQVGAR